MTDPFALEITALDLPPGAQQFSTEGLLAHASGFAAMAFDLQGEVLPMFIAVAEPKIYLIPAGWRDPAHKEMVLAAIRVVFRKLNVERYALMCEAWMASVNPRTEPHWRNLPPSERMDRMEIVSVLAADKHGVVLIVDREIIRPFDGGKPTLGEPMTKFDSSSGPMTTLLDP